MLENHLEFTIKEVINDIHDSEKIIFNYIRLNKGRNKKSVLCKDLNFSVILKSFEISDVLVHSELFF